MESPRRRISSEYRQQLDQGYAFGSVLTFCQVPLVVEAVRLAEWQPDVAVLGAPFDLGTTNRPGARFGPRAIRTQAYESGTYHLVLGVDILDELSVVDVGDVFCPHGQTDRSLANIQRRVAELLEVGAVPFVIGGDHSITWPSATAVADGHGRGNVAMLHFDAHADTADEIDGNLASHGTPMRRLIESGAIPGSHFVQIGLRSLWPGPDTWDWMADQGMHWYLMEDVIERGLAEVVTEALEYLSTVADHVYLSIDIDCLDPAFAPGTGTPEPGGLVLADLLRAVRQVGSTASVVGMDVVEVSPPYDHADITVNAAHRLFMEVLGGMAAARAEQRGAPVRRPGRGS